MSVTDKVGRVKKGERCISLDEDGKRCQRVAKVAVQFHGDPEIDRRWVRAAFCDIHDREGS